MPGTIGTHTDLVGSGANSSRRGGRLSSASLSDCEWAQAASAAFHSSVIVALHPPVLRWLRKRAFYDQPTYQAQ